MPLVVSWLLASFACFATKTTCGPDLVFQIDGKKVFPIGFTTPPPPDGKTPTGKNGIQELAETGATFMRTGKGQWSKEEIAYEQKYEDAAARNGMHCLLYLGDLASIKPGDEHREAMLRDVVNHFKNHPGFGAWKGADEPEWGNHPVAPLIRVREIVRELDPNHPMVLIQAPRGTIESMRKYNVTADVVGADIYPISVPPGIHSQFKTNTEISMVGDYTRIMDKVGAGKMPVWMVLQIAWSGVVKPGKKLVFPNFKEERFMTYEAIINGANALLYFGGNVTQAMNRRDAQLGWNWTFWNNVLRPVVAQIGAKSPLYPALLEPNSTLPVKSNVPDIEYCVRQVGNEIFLLACKRNHGNATVTFSGLPANVTGCAVLYEPGRTVAVKNGQFTDRFSQFDVHVYRLQ
ncbi:MAG: hypothetical protein ACXWC8_04640 [Limisphaerales bacterium]